MIDLAQFDEETLRRARGYGGGFEPRGMKREVFCEYGETEWTLVDFLRDIQEAVAKVPEHLRDVARVDLEGGYEESTKLSITYPDVESDEEVTARVTRAIQYALSSKAEERQQYERLKAKYEPQ